MREEKIIFIGADWCGDCRRSQYFLDMKNIPYEYKNIEKDPQAAETVLSLNSGNRSIPTIIFPDGTVLVEPNWEEIQKVLEAQEEKE